jgi:hypothetical protein
MMPNRGPHSIETAHDLVDLLRGDHGLTLNAAQIRRLAWLMPGRSRPQIWTGSRPASATADLLVVIDPPSSLRLELLAATLAPDTVVVIPCGEDPAYDALKSRLVGFGTVGTQGAEGPHQMWWGGLNLRCLSTSIRTTAARPLTRLPNTTPVHDAISQAERLLELWEHGAEPLLWTSGAEAAPDGLALATLDGDFAVAKHNRRRFAGHTFYFGRRPPAEALLRTWVEFCRCLPTIDDVQLLEQAWCLVTSQTALDTIWLPDCDTQPFRSTTDIAGHYDPLLPERLEVAGRTERTGPPELLMSAATTGERRAIAIVRDANAYGSRALAATMEALAHAFAADPADYRQLEIMQCASRDDLHVALAATSVESVLVVTPAHAVADDAFRRLADDSRLCTVVVAPPLQVFDMAQFRARRVDADTPTPG